MGCCFSTARTPSIDSSPGHGEFNPQRPVNEAAPLRPARNEAAYGALAHLARHNAPAMPGPSTKLLTLPPEILGRVADDLPPDDVLAFAHTCRSLYDTLRDQRRSIVLTAAAVQVGSLREARQILRQIRSDIRRCEFWARPLAALVVATEPGEVARRGMEQHWGLVERSEVFDSAFQMATQVPPEQRVIPLEALAEQNHVPWLSGPLTRFDGVLEQTTHVPFEHRPHLLVKLAQLITDMEPAEQAAKFDALLEENGRLPPEHREHVLVTLAMSLPDVTSNLHAAKFDALLQQTLQLARRHQGAALTALALVIGDMRHAEKAARIDTIMDQTAQLPLEDQSRTLAALMEAIDTLAEPERPDRFNAVSALTAQLPLEHQSEPLAASVRVAARLRVAQPADVAAYLNQVRQLPLEHRADPLTSVAELIADLPAHTQPVMFYAVFTETVQLRLENQAGPLTALADLLPGLPAAGRPATFDLLLERIVELAPVHRDEPLAALADGVGSMPQAERLARFDTIIAETRQLPRANRDLPLAALGGIIESLPAAEQPSRVHTLLNLTWELPPDFRDEPLVALAHQMTQLQAAGADSFEPILLHARRHPPALRATLLEALAQHLELLSVPQRLSWFNTIYDEIVQLPAEFREEPLAVLAQQLASQQRTQPALFNAILAQARRRSPQWRAGLLQACAQQLTMAPVAQRGPWFISVFNELAPLPREHIVMPLATLASNLRYVHENQRLAALDHVFDAVEQLPVEQRSVWLTAFTPQLSSLGWDARPESFDRALGLIRQLPAPHQDESLLALAAQINRLANTDDRPPRVHAILDAVGQLPPAQQAALRAEIHKIRWFDQHDFPEDTRVRLLRELEDRARGL